MQKIFILFLIFVIFIIFAVAFLHLHLSITERYHFTIHGGLAKCGIIPARVRKCTNRKASKIQSRSVVESYCWVYTWHLDSLLGCWCFLCTWSRKRRRRDKCRLVKISYLSRGKISKTVKCLGNGKIRKKQKKRGALVPSKKWVDFTKQERD